MLKSLKDIVPGDIILTRTNTFISKAIRFFGKMQTGGAEYSHAAAGLSNYMCIEALWRTRISDMGNALMEAGHAV